MRCPSELELMRVVGNASSDTTLATHVHDCVTCGAAVTRFDQAIALARQLAVPSPSAAHREEIRTAVLARGARGAARPPAPRRIWVGVAFGLVAAAAAVLLYVVIAPAPSRAPAPELATQARGMVVARPGTRFETTRRSPDEIVRLEDGVIDVEVQPLHPGERFRVIVGDAEVEVRGTAFEVTAKRDHLVAVAVRHGSVEVRPSAGATIVLGTGQSWRAQIASAPEPEVPEPDIAPAPEPARPARPRRPAIVEGASGGAPAPPSPGASNPSPGAGQPPASAGQPPASAGQPARSPDEVAYSDAWTAMRAGAFDRAAAGFARVFILAPDSSLAEDAGFWHAVALARGSRPGVAITAFRDFLALHSKAARAGEASAMLGWLLLDVRERDEAKRRFQAAVDDPNPTVKASARAGLDALARTP